jgi:hypothetical protein
MALSTSHPPVQWALGFLHGAKAVGAWKWTPPSAEVKHEWSYTSTPLTCLHCVDRTTLSLPQITLSLPRCLPTDGVYWSHGLPQNPIKPINKQWIKHTNHTVPRLCSPFTSVVQTAHLTTAFITLRKSIRLLVGAATVSFVCHEQDQWQKA